MELRPVDATYFGLHEHDGRLPDGGAEDVAEEIRLLERLQSDLAAAPAGDVDVEAARYFAALGLYRAREVRLWESMADAPDQIGTGLFLLFARDSAPLDQRLDSIASRLEDVPRTCAVPGSGCAPRSPSGTASPWSPLRSSPA